MLDDRWFRGERVARAEAEAELAAVDAKPSIDQHTALVEDAITEARAHAKLSEIRSALGVAAPEFVEVETDPVDTEEE